MTTFIRKFSLNDKFEIIDFDNQRFVYTKSYHN